MSSSDQAPATPVADLREQIASAIDHQIGDNSDVYEAADNVLAVVQPELDRLREQKEAGWNAALDSSNHAAGLAAQIDRQRETIARLTREHDQAVKDLRATGRCVCVPGIATNPDCRYHGEDDAARDERVTWFQAIQAWAFAEGEVRALRRRFGIDVQPSGSPAMHILGTRPRKVSERLATGADGAPPSVSDQTPATPEAMAANTGAGFPNGHPIVPLNRHLDALPKDEGHRND